MTRAARDRRIPLFGRSRTRARRGPRFSSCAHLSLLAALFFFLRSNTRGFFMAPCSRQCIRDRSPQADCGRPVSCRGPVALPDGMFWSFSAVLWRAPNRRAVLGVSFFGEGGLHSSSAAPPCTSLPYRAPLFAACRALASHWHRTYDHKAAPRPCGESVVSVHLPTPPILRAIMAFGCRLARQVDAGNL